MVYACPKWCTDLKERSKLHAGIQGFFPPLLTVIFSFQLSSLISLHSILPLLWAGTSALGQGWGWQCSPLHMCMGTPLPWHASSIPENKHSPDALPSLLWVKACQKPGALGRQACWPGIEDPQGSGQRELFPSKPHTHLLLERLRPASQRAEPFVSSPTPKVSTNLLPITAKSTTRQTRKFSSTGKSRRQKVHFGQAGKGLPQQLPQRN